MPPASTRSFSMDSARGADASRSSVAVAVAARRDACRLSCEDFATADPHRRLAFNDCVHDLPKASHAVRHFLSSVASAQVRAGLSEAYGTPVRFQSFDISRLRVGQYLRRHSDDLEARVFGLVFHLSAGWHDGCGGELAGEGPGGECMVFRPHQGGVCLIQIGPDREHSVCVVRSADYVRYSIAVHYAWPPATANVGPR